MCCVDGILHTHTQYYGYINIAQGIRNVTFERMAKGADKKIILIQWSI